MRSHTAIMSDSVNRKNRVNRLTESSTQYADITALIFIYLIITHFLCVCFHTTYIFQWTCDILFELFIINWINFYRSNWYNLVYSLSGNLFKKNCINCINFFFNTEMWFKFDYNRYELFIHIFQLYNYSIKTDKNTNEFYLYRTMTFYWKNRFNSIWKLFR